MTKVCSVAGVEVELSSDVFDDIELLDMLDDMDAGNGLKIMKCLKRVFGEQWPKVADAIRSDDGKIHVQDAARTFAEAIKEVGKGNS